MQSGEATGAGRRVITYCLVPRELALKLHEPLRKHFADDPTVDVVVERRRSDRRAAAERREPRDPAAAAAAERRRVRNVEGRRIADRRASQVSVALPDGLPRRARPYAEQILFVEAFEPSTEHLEDVDTARLVTRIQAGASDEFASLYMRYFDRVYSYLKLAFNDEHAAEDATQQVFLKAMQALPRYERRAQPFRAWLFTIVRNYAIEQLQKRARVELVDPSELRETRADVEDSGPHGIEALSWITDRELLMLVERLPDAQRQVLLLRFMMDLATADIAAVLGRTPGDVRILQSRALRFLEERLTALGRRETACERRQMRRRWRPGPVLIARRYQTIP